ncbi:MAG: proline--tRNA ligase [Solirubrobacterales bacterium]
MARLSELFLPTLRDAPADAQALSHKLMVRAGLVRQLGAGMWSYLPAGWRAHRRVEAILREEMDAIGAQEALLPVLQPADPWRATGRWDIPELFKLTDRKGTEYCLAMTHEETVTWHVAQEVRSYRELPLMLYQLQVKARDEARPRAGVLRTREFIMKDAYSFDRDTAGMEATYERTIGAYDRIFDRAGVQWYRVEADVGMMGGAGAHEYMAPCAAGEDEIALAPGYAANLEVASAVAQPPGGAAEFRARPDEVSTPGLVTVEQVAGHLGVVPGALLKAVPLVAEGRGLVLCLVRGDHRLNEIKAATALGGAVRPAGAEEIDDAIGPVGFVGPVGAEVPVVLDLAVDQVHCYVTGANRPDAHLTGVQPGRDFTFEPADLRSVEPGDETEAGYPIEIIPAIEIANIFKLGSRYSDALGATYLDENGSENPIVMASYGIGPARVIAAAIEQMADEKGIVWPAGIAPWDVHIVSLGKPGSEEAAASERLYAELSEEGHEVLLDDRAAGAGEKFTDAELLGCPVRLTVGRRGLADGVVEGQRRADGTTASIALDAVAAGVEDLAREPR